MSRRQPCFYWRAGPGRSSPFAPVRADSFAAAVLRNALWNLLDRAPAVSPPAQLSPPFRSLAWCPTGPSGEEHGPEGEGGESGESGTRYMLSETATEVRSGVELIVDYDSTREGFSGTVRNTTSATVTQVRVEIHLSNRIELGLTPPRDLAAGATQSVELDARGQTFSWFTVHVELGSSTA